MKNVLIVLGIFAVICCIAFMCGGETKPLYEQVEGPSGKKVEEPQLQLDSIEKLLVLKVYDDFNERTKVSYAGKAKNGNIYIDASYNINKNDMLKNKLSEPRAQDFRICIIASHKGAKNVSRVEFSINGGLYILRPNFTKYEGAGKFTMIFNIYKNLDNHLHPEHILEAESAKARVVFDNGSETYELSKESLKPIRVIYKSYIIDGGKFE